ncbi:hypothetical protein P3T29_001542 [Kitasatospora sp. MAP5-34]|nr:hypothetical protein [Kitasatospora sp. MAP5-34]
MVLVELGDPILNYRELAGGAMYGPALAKRGTTETIPFGWIGPGPTGTWRAASDRAAIHVTYTCRV